MQGEFFSSDSIETVADSLVREVVQNSMDAVADSALPVRVRFHVGVCEDRSVLDSLLEDLWPHLLACNSELGALRAQQCRYLTAEDFHTTGLRGDPTEMFETEGRRNEFFYFFRAEGKSSKRTSSRGSWGIGKYTLPMASRINTFVGLTRRADPSEPGGAGPLVLGQAILDHHEMDGDHYLPDGWWCHSMERDGDIEPLPFGMPGQSDEFDPDRFSATFGLERAGEPGLSVVVPFISDELTHAELVASVLKNYGLAIMLGQLTVDIDGEGSRTELAGPTLRVAADQLEPRRRRDVLDEIDLAEWYLTRGIAERVELRSDPGSQKWDRRLSDEESKAVRDALDDGRRVTVRVPMPVQLKSGERDDSWFDVLLQPEEGYAGSPHFYREGLRISEVASPRTHGVRAVVLVSDRPLATMLGAAETPAHVDWQAHTERFRGRFKDGRNWVSFVKKSPGELVRRVRSGGETEDMEVVAGFFSTPANSNGKKGRTKGPGEGTIPPPTPPPPPGPRLFRVERSADGFVITGQADLRPGDPVRVRAAYDVRRGNPMTKWHSADFQLEDRLVEMDGVSEVMHDGNSTSLTVADPDSFRLIATGFDLHRDLVVVAERTEVAE